MSQKSLKTLPKNKGREDSANRRAGASRKSHTNCECLQCSLYQAKFKPAVHPCPNFKKKKMSGSKKPGKVAEPKKVITSRWVVPPKFDSQRTFPRCRCLPPSNQDSREQLDYAESATSRESSEGRKESKPINRAENEGNLREDFYDALEKQAVKTSARSAGSGNQRKSSYKTRKGDDSERQFSKTRTIPDQTRETVRGEILEVGENISPEGAQLRNQDDDIIRSTLPRSVSQGMIESDTGSEMSGVSKSSSAKAGKLLARTGPSPALVAAGRSRSKETVTERKLKRETVRSPDPNLRISSSSVSFSLSNKGSFNMVDSSATHISNLSKSSTNSRGVLKDPRSTSVRSNSAKIFLDEEHLKKLQKTIGKPPEIGSSTNRNQQHPAIASRNVRGAIESSVCSEDPVPKGRLPPSRQFMNICAQELAKRKLIARSKATQELDSTNLFGMERHYEVFSAEAKVSGGTWGIRAYRTVPRL